MGQSGGIGEVLSTVLFQLLDILKKAIEYMFTMSKDVLTWIKGHPFETLLLVGDLAILFS